MSQQVNPALMNVVIVTPFQRPRRGVERMLIVSVANALEDGLKPLKLGVGAAGKGEKSCTASARNEPDTDPFFMVYSVGVPRSGKAQKRACRATFFSPLGQGGFSV